jgi:nitrate/nitrite-specific signal transduction histidine kinase
MTNNVYKRRTVFINKSFQGRFILNVFLLILLSGVCSALSIYWITGGDLQAQSQTAHENITNAIDHLGLSIVIGNLVALVIVGSLTIFMVLYASHKIAGPLYRFEKLCTQIGDDQLDTITSLREHDQLQELGTAFGEMVAKLRSRKDQRLTLVAKLTDHLEQLQQDPAITANYSEHLEQMRQALTQLQE